MVSGLCLMVGYVFIRRRQIDNHRRAMLTATAFAVLFVVVYVSRVVLFPTKIFAGSGWVRGGYITLLISHTIIATALGPFIFVTLRRALRRDYQRHRRLARITLPLWLYVAITGWIVYAMLHAF